MKTIKIDESKVKELCKNISEEVKTIVEKILGKDIFDDGWMELWKEFLKEFNLNLVLPYPNPTNDDEEYIDAQFMMMHIIRVHRKKKPDWDNSNENKYVAWFDMRKSSSGSGFSASSYDLWYASTTCGSRLCMPDDRDMMLKIIEKYIPIWIKIMIEP